MPRTLRWAAIALLVLFAICSSAGAALARPAPFGARHDLTTSFAGASSVFSIDVDGDGDLDVFGAAYNADQVSWWENTAGDGSAWTERVIGTGVSGAYLVSGADIDGDGDADAISAGLAPGSMEWWENTAGDGSAWTRHTLGPVDDCYGLVATDLDHDGDQDIVSAENRSNEVRWWENTAGDGSAWMTHVVASGLNGVESVRDADLDDDGDVDLLIAVSGDDSIIWYENTAGDGSVWTPHLVTNAFTGAVDADAADLDGDGDLDVMGVNGSGDALEWWENTAGDGSAWTTHVIDAHLDMGLCVQAADLDSDGDIDVLGVGLSEQGPVWWENGAGDGSAWIRHNVATDLADAQAAVVADLDSDGDLDVVGVSFSAGDIVWWENQMIHRSAVFPTRSTVVTNFGRAHSVYAGDMDGDGDIDMLGAAYDDNDVAWFENTAGDGTAWTSHLIDPNFGQASAVVSVDMDNDGDLDVLGAAQSAVVRWYENTAGDGSAWTQHDIDTWFWAATSVYPADIDRDGDMDVAGAGFGADDVVWWENVAGDGSAWTEHPLNQNLAGARTVVVADLDGDGDPDVAAAAWAANSITWWENTAGDGSAWIERTVDAAFGGAYSVAAGDPDGDGDLDLFGTALDANEVAWYENAAGDGSVWTKQSVDTGFSRAYSVHVADMDADGDLDMLGAAQDDDDVAWWENVAGDGSVWSRHTVDGDFDGVVSVHTADLDGDGDPDVLGAAYWVQEIAWWENRGGQFAHEAVDTAPLSIPANDIDDVLAITMTHRGRAGDRDEELVSLSLHLFETPGDPLSSAEANAMIDELRIYADDGSGVFEPATDTLIATVDTLTLTTGVQIVTIGDDDPNAAVPHGTPGVFFVAPALSMFAHEATPHQFGMTLLAETAGVAEDRVDDLTLEREYATNVSSGIVQIVTEADLRIVKSVTPARLGPGDEITYTLVYSSAGPSPADGVAITDVIPYTVTNPTYVSSGAPITQAGGSDFVWDVGQLLPMAGGIITVTGSIDPATTGDTTLFNDASIGSDTSDPDAGNNSNGASNTVDALPPELPVLRDLADGQRTTDNTPLLVWYRSISPDTAGYLLDLAGSVRDAGPVTNYTTELLADGVYTWTVAAYDDLDNTSAYTDTWSFEVDTTAPEQSPLISPLNTLYTSTTSFNLQWGASSSPDTQGYLLSFAGVESDRGNTTSYPTGLLADGVYTWTVAVYDDLANTSAYTDVWSLTVDTIPPDPPALNSPGEGEWTADTTPTLMWGDSPSGDTVGYMLDFNGAISDVGNVNQITLPPVASGIYTWTVAAYDPASNVGAYAEPQWFVVNPTAPLIVEKSDARDPLPAGWVLRYRVRVQNTMSSMVAGVTVTDTLPPETRVNAVDAGGQQVGNQVVWNLGDMAAGEVRDLHLSLGMYTTLRGTLTNEVIARGWLNTFANYEAGDTETTEIVEPLEPTPTPTATDAPPTSTPTPVPTIVRLQQGVGGYDGCADAYLDIMNGGANYGPNQALYLKTDDNVAIVTSFDLAGWQDAVMAAGDGEVVAAWLRLHLENTSPADEPITLRVYQLLRPWVEEEVSWTHASQGVMWAAPGANGAGIDRKGLPVAEVECYEPAADADGWIDLDVTDAALYWLAHPAENFGLIVKGYRCGHTTLYRLSASEAGDPALRPQMALGYLPLEPVEVETATPTLTPMPTATGTPSLAPTATATATPTASATATAETAGVVAGHVWLDIVRNGIWQAGEPGLAGATVRLYRDGMPVGNAITPADGGYAFAGLEPGEYVVVETDPAGYGSTTGNNRAVTVVAGGCAEVDFGDYLMDTPTATHTLSPTLTATPEVALVFTPTAMPARGWLPLVWK